MIPSDRIDEKTAARSVWGASPAGTTYGGGAEPGTREFFEAVLAKRSAYEMPWLFDVVPFASFGDRRVLELGCGAGYDAYEIVRSGARYTGVDITPANIDRTRTHLGFYGLEPEALLVADAEDLPLADGSFDAVFSNGVLHHTPDIARAFREASRVLVRGGDFWVIVYHRDSIFHWLNLWLFDHILRLGFRKRTFAERLGMIEFTTSDAIPLVNVYSRRQLRRLLIDSGFEVERMWVRKLVREDLPAMPRMPHFWDWVPQRWLDALGRAWGWYVIAHAVKRTKAVG